MSCRRPPWRAGLAVHLATGLLSLAFAAPLAAGSLTLRGDVQPAAARVELLRFDSDHENGVRWLTGEGPDGDPVATVTVSPAGSFSLEVPGPDLWRVRLTAPGRISLERWLRPLAVSGVLPPVELPADAGLPVTVLAPDGRPVAGALVIVDRSLGGWERWRERDFHPVGRHGRSDESGRLVLPRLAEEPVRLLAWAPGSPTATVEVKPEDEVAVVRFAAGLARPLRLVGDDGEPVAQAIVRLGGTPLAVTGEDGTAVPMLADGAATEVELVAADGRRAVVELPAWQPADDAARAAGPPRAELTLPALRPLAGRVIDAAGEQPVPGALVWIWNDEGEAVTADRHGAFVLPWPFGERTLVAVAPGYRRATAKTAGLAAGRPATLALEPSVRISGRVVDEAGEAVVAAQVRVRRYQGHERVWRGGDELVGTVTGAGGGFEARGLTPGAEYDLRVEAAGFVPGEAVAKAGDTGLEVVLAAAGGVSGRVLDAYGRPLGGARVRLFPVGDQRIEVVDGERQTDHEVRSTPDGRFEAGRLAAGLYDLEVQADGWAPAWRGGLEVPRDGELRLGDVLLDAGASIEGRVVDAEGQPVAGAEVRAVDVRRPPAVRSSSSRSGRFPRLAVSGSDGRFAIEHQPEGEELRLGVTHPDHLDADVTALPGEELVVRMGAAGTVFGRVETADGAPVSEARVEVRVTFHTESLQGSSSGTTWNGGQSGEDGSYRVEKVPPGTARIEASAQGLAPAAPVELEIAPGQRVGPVALVLGEPAILVGRVLSADGEAVEGAYVAVVDPDGGGASGVWSDAEGRYRLDRLAPGPAELVARHPAGGGAAERSLELHVGEQRLDFRLTTRPAIHGRVVDADGRPVAGVRLEVEKLGGAPDERHFAGGAESRHDGSFDVPSLDVAGTYRLEARGDTGLGSVEVEVGDEPLRGVVVELREVGGEISGDVFGLEAEALAEVIVQAYADGGGGSLNGRVAASGRYHLPQVPPGTWRVTATHAKDDRLAFGEVEVGGGPAVLDLVFPSLEPAEAQLEGRLLGSGRPVAGAQLGLEPLDPGEGTRPAATQTDGEGRFRFEPVVAGRYRLRVSGFAANGPVPVVEAGDGEPLLLDLPAVPVTGRVLTPDGQGFSRAMVSLRPVDDPAGWFVRALTDAEGRFSLIHVTPGRFELTVFPLPPSERQPSTRELLVEASGVTGVEIVLE